MNRKLSPQLSSGDLEVFFSLSSDLLAVVQTDGYFKLINPAFEQMLGWKSQDVSSRVLFSDFIHTDDQSHSRQLMAKVARDGQPAVFRSRYRCSDDSWKWLEWTVGRSADVGSESLLYCVGRDIAEQHQVEQNLENSQRNLETSQENLNYSQQSLVQSEQDLDISQRSLRQSEQDLYVSQRSLRRSEQELDVSQRSLWQSEQLFQAIFNQVFQFIGLLTPDGILLEVNETALAFGGITAEQVLDKPFWEAPWWQTSDDVKQTLRTSIAKAAQGEFIRYEVDVLGANDAVATIDFSLKPWRDDSGEVILLIPEGRDITERKAIERELQQLNVELEARVARRIVDIKRYAEAMENMQDGFHLWHLANSEDASSFRLQLSNPSAARLLGLPEDQALGELMLEAMPNLAETPVPDICRHAVVTGKKQDLGDVPYVLPSGELRIFAVKIFPLEAQFLGVLFEDVTEQRQEQQTHIEQKERLKIIFEQAGVGIARLDIAGQWIQANDKLCDILGYSRSELFQKDFRQITHPDDMAQDAEAYRALVSGEIETATMEKRYLRKDGEPIWCNVTASIIYNQDQSPDYFIAFIEDITERKANELMLQRQKDELAMGNLILAQTTANLEERNRELDEFAYVASHDLKAPLRAIANLATWLEEDLEGQLPSENKEQLALLQGRVHRMENLIDGLLEYSRVGRGNHEAEQIDLNLLLQNVVDLLDPPAEFTIAISPSLPTLAATRPALTQVFGNLISNAIKHHNRTDGRVEVSYRLLDNGFHEFSVTDDGPGIDPAFHHKVFNIFQVLEARDKVENTGIGLAIVKKTVEAEGGTVTVESEAGQGSTFRFTWPQQC
ncbi:MAG: PAS domain S-box protein [Cyanobacteria bacterium P01_H01_bin.21]